MQKPLNIEQYIDFTIRNLVNHPDEVKVNKIEGTKETIIEIRVNPEDIGKVIGKNGSVIRAIRTVANAISLRERKKIDVQVID